MLSEVKAEVFHSIIEFQERKFQKLCKFKFYRLQLHFWRETHGVMGLNKSINGLHRSE